MGSHLFVSYLGDFEGRFGAIVEALAERLGGYEALIEMTYCQKLSGRGEEIVRFDTSPATELNLREFADEVWHSPDQLDLIFRTPFHGQDAVCNKLTIRGSYGLRRCFQADGGALEVTIPLTEFRQTVSPWSVDDNPPVSWQQMLDQSQTVWHYDRVQSMFLRLVGLQDGALRRFGVEHAMARVDGHAGIPLSSLFVFHADVRDFILDLELLKRRYREAISSVVLYSREVAMPAKEYLEKYVTTAFEPISNWTSLLSRMLIETTEDEVQAFFKRLDDATLAQFRQLDPLDLELWVDEAARTTGSRWVPEPQGRGGAVVGPLHREDKMTFRNLFGFYSRLLDIADLHRAG